MLSPASYKHNINSVIILYMLLPASYKHNIDSVIIPYMLSPAFHKHNIDSVIIHYMLSPASYKIHIHTMYVAFQPDYRLPNNTITLQTLHSDPDIAFLQYIIQCFETKTNIRPTVFIRHIPIEHHTNIQEVLQNMTNALLDIPAIIPGKVNTVYNHLPIFQEQLTIRQLTEKPTLFGFNLFILLKHLPVYKLRGILKFFQDNQPQQFGFFWTTIASHVPPPPFDG